jgi:hypothetical protein
MRSIFRITAGLGLAAAIAACTAPTTPTARPSSSSAPGAPAATPGGSDPSPVRSLPLPDGENPSGPSPTIEIPPPLY